jgi:FecR-like protein
MDLRARPTLTRLLTLLLSTVAPMSRGHTEGSGKVGAVNQDATGTPPGGSTRTLVVGTGVVYKEKIETSAQGSTQILFPDQSTLNLGRNSSIVIDEYVYDPKTGTGSMAASLGKGVMRFVGGQISHTAGITVDTPVSTLGIRGGVATVVYPVPPGFAPGDPDLAGASGELVIGHVGVLTLRNKVSQVTIRPGFATWVSGPDAPILPPFRISDIALAKIVAALTSGPGQTGGAGNTVSPEAFIVRDGIGTVILDNPAHPPGTDPLGFTSIFGGGNDIARSKSQSNQIRNGAPPPYGAH